MLDERERERGDVGLKRICAVRGRIYIYMYMRGSVGGGGVIWGIEPGGHVSKGEMNKEWRKEKGVLWIWISGHSCQPVNLWVTARVLF